MEHQIHYEKKFYKDHQTGYWISCSCPKIRAHVWVWQYHHGKPPKSCHIHHRDHNKSNNSIENLELMDKTEHLRLHMTPERRKKASKWANEIRKLTKEWHASKEGLAWHKYHAEKCKFGKWNLEEIKCSVCGIKFKPKVHHQCFCSNACKSKWRRDSGIDNIKRTCVGCKTEFTTNKYSKVKYCNRNCRYR